MLPRTFVCRIRHRSRGETLLLQLDVASSSGIVATLSGRQGGFAPYRIDNCSAETLHVQQAGCPEQEDVLKAYSSLPYAWDEPSLPHKVRLHTPTSQLAPVVIHAFLLATLQMHNSRVKQFIACMWCHPSIGGHQHFMPYRAIEHRGVAEHAKHRC